ncbi:MAG TPA: RNA polymerase sigma factor [Gammaproteobacteria bacterium]|nr:RNA polymerase sigma factor [Gammaproteobacteria bacterium]
MVRVVNSPSHSSGPPICLMRFSTPNGGGFVKKCAHCAPSSGNSSVKPIWRDVMTTQTLEVLVAAARNGDGKALEAILGTIQKEIYNLALRMLWCPHDAADACQEILLKIVTRLSSFEGRSAFRTWAFRVAVNHLLNQKAGRVEAEHLSFEQFGADLAQDLAESPASTSDPEYARLIHEVRIGCTHAMLICLDREHRAAFVLGDILQLSSQEAAYVMDLPDAAFRKRRSRARQRIVEFMRTHCGLVEEAAPCRCERRVDHAVATGIVNRSSLLFASNDEPSTDKLHTHVAELSALQRSITVHRRNPMPDAPDPSLDALKQLLRTGAVQSLQ